MALTKAKGGSLQLDDDLASILAGLGLSLVAIEDSADNFTGADGEAALAELALRAPIKGVTAKSANYTVVAADKEELFNCTSTFTFTLIAAAIAGDGFSLVIVNTGSGIITIDGNAAETINGSATLVLQAGGWAVLACTGTAWVAYTYEPATAAEVIAGTDAKKVVTPATLVTGGVAGTWEVIDSPIVLAGDSFAQFEGIDNTYAKFMLICEHVAPSVDGATLQMQFGTGATPTYDTGANYDGGAANQIALSGVVGNAALEAAFVQALLSNLSSATEATRVIGDSVCNIVSGAVSALALGNDYDAATAVTALQIFFSTGTLLTGTITLYGLKT